MANLNLCLFAICFVRLGLVASSPVQKVITNNCDGQDCGINVIYNDGSRDISLQTNSNDSVVSALLDITIPRNENSDQNDLVRLMGNVVQMLSSIVHSQQDNQQQLDDMIKQLDIEPSHTPELLDYVITSPEPEIMQDCANAPASGQYSISPVNGSNPFLVVCDMDTTSGGWIVIQRRFDGSVDFDRNWCDYESGFGSLDGEFWLGLRKMHTLTSHGTWKVRFDLEDFGGKRVHAEYGFFQVGDSASNYQLTIRSYSGDAGDAMLAGHNVSGMAFSTKGHDNDNNVGNCAETYGGWWHKNCGQALINSHYLGQVTNYRGMHWYQWKKTYEVLKKTEMKIKFVD